MTTSMFSGWVGWLKEDDGPWREVTEGRTRVEALDNLLDVKSTAKRTDRQVLPAGAHPDQRQRRGRARR
jgi:hypothetical protein